MYGSPARGASHRLRLINCRTQQTPRVRHRQGRWHNQKFAELADELRLDATKDSKIGWSPCTLRKETSTTCKSVIADLKKALIAYRHPEMTGGQVNKRNDNAIACACQCPRRFGSPKAVLAGGEITCGVCDSTFDPDE